MPHSVMVALAGSPTNWQYGLQHPEDFVQPWEERQVLELEVEDVARLGDTLVEAARQFDIEGPPWAEGPFAEAHLAFVDFFRADAPSVTLRREFPLVDEEGRLFIPRDWHEVTHGELLRAAEAGVLPGDPQRLYLLVQPGIGNGLLSDFVSQADLWQQYWEIFKFVWSEVGDEALKGFGLWQLWKWIQERKVDQTPEIVRGHLDLWRDQGLRPDNLRDFIGQGPWRSEQIATLLRCEVDEAEALLLGYGCSRSQDGLWRKGTDPSARFMQDTIELLIALPAVDREAFRELMEQRLREMQTFGQSPPVDFNALHQLPQDQEAAEAQAERWRKWSEERYPRE